MSIRSLSGVSLIVTIASLGAHVANAQAPENFLHPLAAEAVASLEGALGEAPQISVSPTSGLVTFLSTRRGQPVPGTLAAFAPASDRASAFLDAYGLAFGVTASKDLTLLSASHPDEVGMEHVRYQQLYRGVPVTGGEIVVHLLDAGVTAVNAKTLMSFGSLDPVPTLTAEEAVSLIEPKIRALPGGGDAEFTPPRIEVFNRGLLEGRETSTRLAWFLEASSASLREFIWIDAHSGSRLLHFSQLPDARVREIHDADDPFDGVYDDLSDNPVRGEGDGPTSDTDVDSAYDYSGNTYDYFLANHARDSYDGAGAALRSWVRFCPSSSKCPYENAFWNGTQMVYGEGFPAADDVVAHELTHAVTQHTANLFYYMQSGALSESYSDIFGETVDLGNGAGTDAPGTPRTAGSCSQFFPNPPGSGDNSYRWLIGEDVPGFGAIRDMWTPTCFLDPGKMTDAQFVCQDPGTDQGGVHSNSGVPNHAFALMVDGGTYNGKTVTALGLAKAAKIHYRALAHYLTSASDLLDNYHALNRSCQDLIGTAGITAAHCTEVGDALDAVEMSSGWPCSFPNPQAAIPPLCTLPASPDIVFYEDFDTSTWLSACPSETFPSDWCENGPGSFFGAYATSGTGSIWGYDRETAGTISAEMFAPDVLPAGSKLQFKHSYGFENTGGLFWDGGVVEYHTGGGFIDAGPKIVAGATYDGPIACCSNPLADRNGFVGDSWGYTATQMDFAAEAGKVITLRFQIGTDSSVGDRGWFVDDLVFYTCAECLADRYLSSPFNGTGSHYKAANSIFAGFGFTVGLNENVTLEAPVVEFANDFSVDGGDLTVINKACVP